MLNLNIPNIEPCAGEGNSLTDNFYTDNPSTDKSESNTDILLNDENTVLKSAVPNLCILSEGSVFQVL